MTDPREFNLPHRTILADNSSDRLGLALIALMREVWVVKDRVATLEAVLQKQGLDVSAAIETFEPDDEHSARLQAEGDAFIKAVTDTLSKDAQ